IPNRPHFDFAASVFAEESTEAEPINIFGHFDNQMMVDKRIHIDVSSLTIFRILKARAGEDIFKLIDVTTEPGPLSRSDLIWVWLDIKKLFPLAAYKPFTTAHRPPAH